MDEVTRPCCKQSGAGSRNLLHYIINLQRYSYPTTCFLMLNSMIRTNFFLLLLLLFVPAASLQAAENDKPNIVVFLADDMGWGDSGTYGHELIKTPNMDKMASEGVMFTQCYSACGVCSPSRSSILTGRTPYRNGVYRHLSGCLLYTSPSPRDS